MPKFEANMNYIPPSPPSSIKQCNKSATVKFHMELLLTTTTRKQSRSGATPATAFYRRNDTHNFCCSSVRSWAGSSFDLFVQVCSPYIIVFYFFFFKLIPYICSLDKCHTSAFKVLVLCVIGP